MSRRLTFFTLAMLPLLPATAGTESDCTAYGWTVYEVTDSQGYPNPYRLALITRLKTSGGRTYPVPVTVTKGLAICPGDKLDTWHGATTTLVRGNNVAGAVAESGSVLHFSDRIVQEAGTVTYLMPSGWDDSIEATLKEGALLVSSMLSTVQVSMSGPSCDPTVEVSVSALDDPFIGSSPTPNPKAHRAQLTLLDSEGRPRGTSLELHGDQSVRITPGTKLPAGGGPTSESARAAFERSEPLLRAPFAQRGPPTAVEQAALSLTNRRLLVYADARPVSLRVNGIPWAPRGWFREGRGGLQSWQAARMISLPPGPSIVELMLSDGRGRVVMTPATGDVIVDFLVRDEALSEPIEPVAEVALTPIEPPIEVLPPPVVVPCEIPALGGPSGTMYQPTVRGLDMTFVGLSDGQFCRGSPKGVADDNVEDDETPQHPVKISGFLLGMSEVTQAQWRVVVEAAKLAKDVDALSLNADPSAFKGDKLPVENVGWCDVLRFANVLSRLDGRAPAYEITVIPETTAEERYLGHCMVRWTANANGYRLPTEAEWEYAARAGTTTAFATGDDEAALTRAGWYGAWTDGAGGNSGGEPHDVCTRPEKPWGLCDLHGNVWEWVFNGNEVYVQHVSDVTVDPGHPSSDASSGFVETSSFTQPRGVRGGSWVEGPVYARSAYRNSAWADRANGFIGFRLVLPSSKRP